MNIRQDGDRTRVYAERVAVEAREGNPLRDDVSKEARRRLIREIAWRTGFRNREGTRLDFMQWWIADLNRVLGKLSSGAWNSITLETAVTVIPLPTFLSALELAAARIVQHRSSALEDLEVLQSILADDLSLFRFVNVGTAAMPRIQVQRIDNPHLHTVLTDRTFELTRIAELASAQQDYADAWRHYPRPSTSLRQVLDEFTELRPPCP